METRRYRDRRHAGVLLAEKISALNLDRPVVLGLARGGVVVAAEVARQLEAPLDVFVARKLGVPWQPELGFGAVAPGITLIEDDMVQRLSIPELDVERVVERETEELNRRLAQYRGGREPLDLHERNVVLVDDGLATGITALASCRSVRKQDPLRLVFSAPICSTQGLARLKGEADEAVAERVSSNLFAVGAWYEDFSQTTDEEVERALSARQSRREVRFGNRLGELEIPSDPVGVVVFAHGSGSGRSSPRNQMVAKALNDRGLATLLFDLLEPSESERRFDIPLLASRLKEALAWVREQPDLASLGVGLFGASTGAAAAVDAAADAPEVRAVVSRGGRPDLANAPGEVRAPVLLIVGGEDHAVMPLNQQVMAQMPKESRLEIVPGATHLFEERGALERVAELAGSWFVDWLK